MSNWRVGSKVPLNVYCGDRPVCQCHTEEDARRIVAAFAEVDSLRVHRLIEQLAALREALQTAADLIDFDNPGAEHTYECQVKPVLESPDPGAELLARHAAELERERGLLDGVREQRDSLLRELNGTRTIHAAELGSKDRHIQSAEVGWGAAIKRAEAAESALADLRRETGHSPDYMPGMYRDPCDPEESA